MNELEKYLIAREHIKEFYEDVVWVKLEKKIDELCEKIRDYDETVYENLTKNRHAIPYLKKAATTLFTENIKVNTEADKKKIPKTNHEKKTRNSLTNHNKSLKNIKNTKHNKKP